MALRREDVEASESPLLLAVARQLTRGPRELYGPMTPAIRWSSSTPPLYYRLAVAAWPMAHAGLDPDEGALVSGRTISFAASVVALAGAFFLARLRMRRESRAGGRCVWPRPRRSLAACSSRCVPICWASAFRPGGRCSSWRLEATRPDRRNPLVLCLLRTAACVKQHFSSRRPSARFCWRPGPGNESISRRP